MPDTNTKVSTCSSAAGQSAVNASVNVTEKQGTMAASSSTEKPADVTASVNVSANNQALNPFIVPVPPVPTQEGPMGIRYDFNDGALVLLPKGKWHVQIEDAESDNIIFVCDTEEGWVLSSKKYYIPFRIKVWVQGEREPVLNHTLDLKGKEVQI